MKRFIWMIAAIFVFSGLTACGTGGEVVRKVDLPGDSEISKAPTGSGVSGRKTQAKNTVPKKRVKKEEVGEKEQALIKKIRKAKAGDNGLKKVIKGTVNYSVHEYFAKFPQAAKPDFQDMSVGPYDVMDITVFGEAELSRENVHVSADGYITFPLLGRVRVDGLTPSEIELLVANQLVQEQIMLDAHVAVTVREYRSKNYKVFGSVKSPGTYPLKARERVLDAISRSGGIDFEQGGKHAVIIRTMDPNKPDQNKIAIHIELAALLKGGDQRSDLLLMHKDLLYIPKAESFYIIGQVKSPGSFPYLEKEITLVEAISMAGGFTQIAARNRTRIVRMENGIEKVIQIKVDAITGAGRKGQDVVIRPGDVIVIPESYF